ncbi:MAG: hypothetical protein O3A92_10010 [Verrucomicrobia bacterium]|nr:hypothetical protein [Verrucomicrobiota bacterium]
MNTPTKLLVLLSALTFAACDKKVETSVEVVTPPSNKSLDALLLPDAPANAITVTEARKNPVPGTEVVITGDLIGKPEVFVHNRSMLTIGDPAVLTSCNRMPGDSCASPWDVCCDDPDLIKKSIATVQVLDADGKLLPSGLKGLGGMKELSSIVIKGTVADGSGPDNLLITANGIHIASIEPNNTPR